MLKKLILITLFSLIAPLMLHADRIELAKGGKPAATIVLPASPAKPLLEAASDLQLYVKAICGVELPIQKDGKKAAEGAGLYLGKNELSKPGDKPEKSATPDTCVITVRDGSVFFNANTSTSVTYGIYVFLEEYLGVRWFAPGQLWEYVPKAASGELAVNITTRRCEPTIKYRVWPGTSNIPYMRDWCRRHKAIGNEIRAKNNFDNSIHNIFPPEKYGKEHPEYYPLINGKRYIPEKNSRHWRPCESNPEVQRIVVEHIRNAFDKAPSRDSFGLGQDDVFYLCECPNCVALDNEPDALQKMHYSNRHYKFINAIAREVGKTHPDRFIGTLTYSPTRVPPSDVPKMEPNTFGFITLNAAQWKMPEKRQEEMELIAEWARRIPYLSTYEYIGLGCVTPRYYPRLLEEEFRYCLKHNIQGMYTYSPMLMPTCSPMAYALIQLQWNAGQKLDDILDDFFGKMFGECAPEMKEYFDHLENSYRQALPKGRVWEYNDLRLQATTMTPAQAETAAAILARAKAKAKAAQVRERIQEIEEAQLYANYLINEYALIQQAIANMPATHQERLTFIDATVRLGNLAHEREKFWAASKKSANLFGESLRALAARGNICTGQITSIERDMMEAAITVLETLQKEAPKEYEAKLKQFQALGNSNFTQTLLACFAPANTHTGNLLPNPGFEKVGKNDKPLNWSSWAWRPIPFGVEAGAGRTGNAARLNPNISAIYYFERTVKPGEKYYAEAWFKGGGKCQGNASLVCRFKYKGGKPFKEHDLEPQALQPVTGEWQRLRISCIVPEGVNRMSLYVGGTRIMDGSFILADDAVLQKIYSEEEIKQREASRDVPAASPPSP